MQQTSFDQQNGRDLLVKYIAGEALPDEAMMVEDWITASDENRRIYEELAAAWHASAASDVVYKAPNVQQEWAGFQESVVQPPVHKLKRRVFYYLAAACVLALVVMLVRPLIYKGRTDASKDILIQSAQDNLHKELPDRTRMVLVANSAVTYNNEFDTRTRKVTLTGEGFFEVTHNAQKPFIIDLGGINLQVLGTSFRIQNDRTAQIVEVEVVTGKVMLYSDTDTLIVMAGETGLYDRKALKFERLEYINVNNFGYATQQFSFTDLPLQQVAQYLEKAYNVKISFKTPAVAACRLSAQFEKQPLNDMLEVITSTFGITWHKEGTTIVIDGKGCD